MSDTSVIPVALTVRNLFEDLLGRDVNVSPGDPMTAADLPTAVIAVYADTSQQLYAVLGMQLALAANAGAALGLLPAGAAEDAIDRDSFPLPYRATSTVRSRRLPKASRWARASFGMSIPG